MHGWLVNPQEARTAAVFGNRSYNELVELLFLTLGDEAVERLGSATNLSLRSSSIARGGSGVSAQAVAADAAVAAAAAASSSSSSSVVARVASGSAGGGQRGGGAAAQAPPLLRRVSTNAPEPTEEGACLCPVHSSVPPLGLSRAPPPASPCVLAIQQRRRSPTALSDAVAAMLRCRQLPGSCS